MWRIPASYSFITMLLITKDAEGEFWPWDVAQFNGARETLVFWGIVVLQTNLALKQLKMAPIVVTVALVK